MQVKSKHHLVAKLLEFGFGKVSPCSSSEDTQYQALSSKGEALPSNVYFGTYTDPKTGNQVQGFYKYIAPNMTQEEINQLVNLEKLETLRTIKNWVMFFGIVTIIGLVGGLIAIIKACN
ncbi:MAG: hypothetical protein IKO51_04410 [Clostridia bacterium]|nr:hypothetical protein [Clostridia bacterium]